ncbi:DUF2809 domain-containing protein [Flavivirga aquatica]|uniref:DUF2809 domain-containing protein n=1 Tax=Flavivirga aquatica TaxID=1849968 RepID=UPI0009F53F28
MTFKFNKTYLILTITLFITEVLIALYLTSGFIRYTVGDFLVVILLYCFFKSFILENYLKIALSVLLFSFFVEFMQLINILNILNIQDNQLLRT